MDNLVGLVGKEKADHFFIIFEHSVVDWQHPSAVHGLFTVLVEFLVSQPVLTFAQDMVHDILTVVDDCDVQGSLPLVVLLLEIQFFASHQQFDHG
jgi:hypothetical protein